MPEYLPLEIPEDGKLSANIVWFARALRVAGVPLGPGRVLDAIRAVEAAGFSEKRDFYYVLQACFVSKPAHLTIFDQVFRLFWRDPRYLEQMMSVLLPMARGVQKDRVASAAEKRAAEALLNGAQPDLPDKLAQDGNEEIEIDASRTISSQERLRHLDFEQMSVAEMVQTKRILASLRLPVPPIQSRRTYASVHGPQIDWRKTLRDAMRQGGDLQRIAKRKKRIRWPNLVALCDISGSMSQYSRVLLQFLHAIANEKGAGWAGVHAFTFGTRLTNITRHMRTKDVDAALSAAGAEAQDWEGGTRIGECLHAFNRDWSRRVLGQGAVVLLITDGLDRDDPVVLAREMQRLQLSARQVIWLNPLMRYDEFLPKAKGIAVMMPHVDSFRAGHNLASLEGLAAAITRRNDVGEKARMMAYIRNGQSI